MARGYPGTKGPVKKQLKAGAQSDWSLTELVAAGNGDEWVLQQLGPRVLSGVPVELLLKALQARGGTLKAVAEAQLLVLKKSADYNQSGMKSQDAEAAAQADRDVYFPFLGVSYCQMIHVKAQRLISLVMKTMRGGGESNFEGIRDTLLDIINYASFWIERMDRAE